MQKIFLLAAVLMSSCLFAGDTDNARNDGQVLIVDNDKNETQLWNDDLEQPGIFAAFDNDDKSEGALSNNANENNHENITIAGNNDDHDDDNLLLVNSDENNHENTTLAGNNDDHDDDNLLIVNSDENNHDNGELFADNGDNARNDDNA